MRTWDYIVVGAGTAGCVLARRLVENTGGTVLLLEAGGRYASWLLNPPLPGMKFGRLFTWPQVSVPQARLGGRQIHWPMGRVVGGTSSVNAMMAFTGHPANFDAWEAAGNPGWCNEALQPYFTRAFGGASEGARDDMARLSLASARYHSAFSEAFLQACEQAGLHREDPLNGLTADRCGYFPVLQRKGERWESARAYLEKVSREKRLVLQTWGRVRHILLEKNRAVGVELARGRKREHHRATRGVILCAGVFETPRILQCSGIGPVEVLQQAGIPVQIEAPAVGANFQDHTRVGVLHRSGSRSPGSKRFWVTEFLRYLLKREGVMTSNCCESGAFFYSAPGIEVPDLQLITHFQTFGPKYEVDIEVCHVAPRSRGRVFISPDDPFDLPCVDPNFLAESSDETALLRGIHRVREICAQPSLQDFPLLEETFPGSGCVSEEELRQCVRASVTTAYHPCGSCAMGPVGRGALGADLRVHGAEALWVADASAMPLAPSGNIACAVVVLAEKAADCVLRSDTKIIEDSQKK